MCYHRKSGRVPYDPRRLHLPCYGIHRTQSAAGAARAAVFKEAYIEAFNKMEADRDRVHLFFFAYTPTVYFSGGEVEDSILKAPLIPWKYRGFYVSSKVRARRRELVLTGKSLKVCEGAREDHSPRGGARRSVPERSRLGVLLRGTILSCSPRPARTGSG